MKRVKTKPHYHNTEGKLSNVEKRQTWKFFCFLLTRIPFKTRRTLTRNSPSYTLSVLPCKFFSIFFVYINKPSQLLQFSASPHLSTRDHLREAVAVTPTPLTYNRNVDCAADTIKITRAFTSSTFITY